MAFLDTLDENQPDATKTGADLDNAIRDTRKSIKDTYDLEHSLTGEHSFFKGNTAARPPAGHLGRIYFNTQTGDIEYDDGAVWAGIGFFTKRFNTIMYVGDGNVNQAIINVGFQPTCVILLPVAGGNSYIKTDSFANPNSFKVQDGSIVATGIMTFDVDGFTVGILANAGGISYAAICTRKL